MSLRGPESVGHLNPNFYKENRYIRVGLKLGKLIFPTNKD